MATIFTELFSSQVYYEKASASSLCTQLQIDNPMTRRQTLSEIHLFDEMGDNVRVEVKGLLWLLYSIES